MSTAPQLAFEPVAHKRTPMISKKWTEITCWNCNATGQVARYSHNDFEGPEECRTCQGTGRVFRHDSGMFAEYPGGRILGTDHAIQVVDGNSLLLTQGYSAIVDPEDVERVSRFKWFAHIRRRKDGSIKTVYAMRNLILPNGKKGIQYLHRFILGIAARNVWIDHENNNGLDCRRGNIRVASPSQNGANSRKKGAGSLPKGISRTKNGKRFHATIKVNRKTIHLGTFDTLEEASAAYMDAAKKNFGEFANAGARP